MFRQSVKDIIHDYKSLFPDELERLAYLEDFSKGKSFKELSDRKIYLGHITASSIVISRKTGQVLMVNKPVLQMHLQPGGHILPEDPTPLHAAVRHLFWRLPEGFVNRLTYLQWHYNPIVPMDIDIHDLSQSPQDGEPPHKHFDLRYLFLGDEEMLSEDTEMYRKHNPLWKDFDYISNIKSFQYIIPKLSFAFSSELAIKRFYSDVIRDIIAQGISRKSISVIAVAHIIPDIVDYLMTLDNFFNLKGVIAKPKSIDDNILKKLIDRGIPVVKFKRGSIELENFLDNQIDNDENPLVLMDIGGWFAPIINKLSLKHNGKLIGIVEDTENGHQKYLALPKLELPIYSIARSPLKDYEDFLIGKSIVYSADAILRTQGVLIEYLNCSVIGYGKIGKSIAQQLANRGIQPTVYDKQATKRLEAYNRGFKLQSWSDMLSTSDVIFSATGGHATNAIDFKLIKSGCYIFSVTSADDEFDFEYFNDEYKFHRVTDLIDKGIGNTNYFYLVCKGNAVNFIHGACVGDFIHLSRSEMIYAVASLAKSEHQLKIYSVDDVTRETIANSWIRTFLRINDLLFDKDRSKALSEVIDSLKETKIL